MKTEEETIQARGPRHAAPPSLQELAPLSATIIDSRGRQVPVCSAGFVLRAGRSYRLRIVSPPDTGFALAGLLLALVLAAYALASIQLRHRTRDLRTTFNERYPPLDTTT